MCVCVFFISKNTMEIGKTREKKKCTTREMAQKRDKNMRGRNKERGKEKKKKRKIKQREEKKKKRAEKMRGEGRGRGGEGRGCSVRSKRVGVSGIRLRQ